MYKEVFLDLKGKFGAFYFSMQNVLLGLNGCFYHVLQLWKGLFEIAEGDGHQIVFRRIQNSWTSNKISDPCLVQGCLYEPGFGFIGVYEGHTDIVAIISDPATPPCLQYAPTISWPPLLTYTIVPHRTDQQQLFQPTSIHSPPDHRFCLSCRGLNYFLCLSEFFILWPAWLWEQLAC